MEMLQQMVVFFIMVAVGWVARRARIITRESQPQFSAFVASIAGPCLMVASAVEATERMDTHQVANIYLVFAALLAVMLVIGALLPVLMRFPKRDRGVVNLLYWLTNIGFLGMPLMGGVYGSESMIYITLFILPNNVLLYTYGIWCVSASAGVEEETRPVDLTSGAIEPCLESGSKRGEGKGAPCSTRSSAKKARMSPRMLLNPGVVASVIAMVIYFGDLVLPYVLARSVSLVGGLTAPLAMMLVGASLFDVNIKHMLSDVRLWLFTVLSMIVLPIALTLVFKQFVTEGTLLAACMVILACPSGVMASIFASIYNEDAYLFSSECIALTTLVSVVTLPLVSLATGV